MKKIESCNKQLVFFALTVRRRLFNIGVFVCIPIFMLSCETNNYDEGEVIQHKEFATRIKIVKEDLELSTLFRPLGKLIVKSYKSIAVAAIATLCA
jgi:hypothetical protein